MTRIHPAVLRAMNEIDAAFFSGDTFLEEENLTEIEEFVDRWKRKIQENRGWIAEWKEEDDTYDDDKYKY